MSLRLHVGTSGFSYDEWRGAFYPDALDKKAMLAFYSARLPSVEVNNTFYRMPTAATVAKWGGEVPAGFSFAIKASQRITWTQKLRDCGETLRRLFEVTLPLGDKLGCVFYQVPKWVKKDVPLLREFAAQQRPGLKVAFEFAHASWLDDDALQVLRDIDAALVHSDRDEEPVAAIVAAGSWAYLRLRRTAYDDAALLQWRDRLVAQGQRQAFVFFKHEDACAGPALAQRFLALVAGDAGTAGSGPPGRAGQ